MSKERIGLVGVGLMGHGMGKNIVEKGWSLTVVAHRNRAPVEDLKARGASEVATPREVADNSDIVILCVTGSPQVEEVINGPNGLRHSDRPVVICDCSTSEPTSTLGLAADLASQGKTLIDAPLSRTPKDAEAGNLDVMVGGPDETVQRVMPVLQAFGSRVVHTGPTGSGHAMKLLNNFLALGYAALYSEALTLGATLGLSPAVFDSVIRGGRMDCSFYQTFFKYVLERDRNAHLFTIANAFKDLSYLGNAAIASKIANPIGSAVRNSFALAVAAGRSEGYVPMLSDVIAEANDVKLQVA